MRPAPAIAVPYTLDGMKLFVAALALALAPIALYAQAPEQPPAHPSTHPEDGPMPASMHKPPVPPAKALNVTYAGKTVTLTVADLAAMPQTTVHVHNAHLNTEEEYTGPLVSEVLAKAGLVSSHETEPLILHSNLLASATDHYYVVYSMAEVQPSFSRSQVIVAIMKSGLPDTDGGVIQLINTDGAKPARWVHGLVNLNVMTVQQN